MTCCDSCEEWFHSSGNETTEETDKLYCKNVSLKVHITSSFT